MGNYVEKVCIDFSIFMLYLKCCLYLAGQIFSLHPRHFAVSMLLSQIALIITYYNSRALKCVTCVCVVVFFFCHSFVVSFG